MLQAYFDDSGTHEGSHNCVVAGYWGGVNRWKRFEREWSAVLARESIEEFHANEFWPRIKGERLKPYRGWTDERHATFIRDLLKVIFDSAVVPFGCGVLGAEWNEQPLSLREVITLADRPEKAKSMFIPFQRNIYRAASYCKPGVRMHFVIDDSTEPKVKSGIHRCFDAVKHSSVSDKDGFKDKLGDLTFADSKKAAPLQAADLLAYEMHRYAKQKVRNVNTMRAEYKISLLRMRDIEDFWLFDGPRFERIQRIFPEESQ
jgi:hypothetical protein